MNTYEELPGETLSLTLLFEKLQDGRYACRIRGLGLTGYGKTKDDALSKLCRMLASYVYVHSEIGTLQGVLERSGIKQQV